MKTLNFMILRNIIVTEFTKLLDIFTIILLKDKRRNDDKFAFD